SQPAERLQPRQPAHVSRRAAAPAARPVGARSHVRRREGRGAVPGVAGVGAGAGTFVRVAGVEPTNSAAERALRPAVLWRKRSPGSRSGAGCRRVERMLATVQGPRVQQRNVLAYLHGAITAHRAKLPAPKLLPTG